MQAIIDAKLLAAGTKRMAGAIPEVGLRAGRSAAEPTESKMVSKVHVQTGELRSSIGVKINTPYHTRVGADAPHAFIEASKGGDHDFFFGELVYLEEGGWANVYVDELRRSL